MANKHVPYKAKIKTLYISIIACFVLMGCPAVILIDNSGCSIMNVPVLYIYIFVLWLFLCALTFWGYRLKWGDKDKSRKNR